MDDRVDPYDPQIRRKNIRLFLLLLVALVIVSLVPAFYRRAQQPYTHYPTYEEARAEGAVDGGSLPGFVVPGSTNIHARYHRTTQRLIVRFTHPENAIDAVTEGLRPLDEGEVRQVRVPTTGWDRWWLISTRTLTGSQGEVLQVFDVPAERGGGYVVVDPRTRHVYYWSR